MIIIKTPFVKRVDRWIKITVVTLYAAANVWAGTEFYLINQKLKKFQLEEKQTQERRIPSEYRGRVLSTSNIYK